MRTTPARVAMALLALLAVILTGSVLSAPGATAAPCMDCPDDPPPPPGTPKPLYELWAPEDPYYTNLHVLATEDNTGNDEAYLTINGTTMWGPHSVHFGGPNDGPGNGRYNVPFRAPTLQMYVDIAMYDEDWPDPDDNLGTFHYQLPTLNVGQTLYNLSLRFDADSADYILGFNITRIS